LSLEVAWASALLVAIVLGTTALPWFRFLDDKRPAPKRLATIDGLRGVLALSVFVYHLVMTHRYIESGVWELPDSRYFRLLGPVGVSGFFMLTGLLFWGKLLNAEGRPRWGALYLGRVFRIGPMYLVAVAVMLVIVFARTGLGLRVPADALMSSLLQWLALGLIDTQPDVNGQVASQLLAGVTWTLWYEWVYYLSLWVVAPFAKKRLHLSFSISLLALCLAAKLLWRFEMAGFAALFAMGMVVGSLLHEGITLCHSNCAGSIAAMALLLLVLTTSSSGYGTWTALGLAGFFYLVCSGASLFGLLTTAAAQRLGAISYSLYLLQGLVLTLVLAIPPVRRLAMASNLSYWVIGLACAWTLVLAAALGYTLIEAPGMAVGRRVARWGPALPRSLTSR